MKKKIAIIGAGIAGLTFANLVKKKSEFEFMIYEKKEILSLDEGYGIQLSSNSVSILNQIGFKKVNDNKIFNPNKLNFFSMKNEKICDFDLTKFNSEEVKYTTLQRSSLIEFLKDDIFNQHFRFGKNIIRISELKNKILINFEDNTSDIVDYVVAADGIFSNIKSLMEKSENKPKFKNAIAIRTILKSNNAFSFDKKDINLFMGDNSHMVIYPLNKMNEFNLVCILREKKQYPDNIKDLINKKIVKQNLNLKSLFENDLKIWPLYSTTAFSPSINNKIFYLGDAFHGFLPTMAQGASQSIESAYELFNLLKEGNKNIHHIYFHKRSQRAKIIKKRSDFNFFSFHISNIIIKKLRNIVLKRLVKSKKFINNYIGEVYRN